MRKHIPYINLSTLRTKGDPFSLFWVYVTDGRKLCIKGGYEDCRKVCLRLVSKEMSAVFAHVRMYSKGESALSFKLFGLKEGLKCSIREGCGGKWNVLVYHDSAHAKKVANYTFRKFPRAFPDKLREHVRELKNPTTEDVLRAQYEVCAAGR